MWALWCVTFMLCRYCKGKKTPNTSEKRLLKSQRCENMMNITFSSPWTPPALVLRLVEFHFEKESEEMRQVYSINLPRTSSDSGRIGKGGHQDTQELWSYAVTSANSQSSVCDWNNGEEKAYLQQSLRGKTSPSAASRRGGRGGGASRQQVLQARNGGTNIKKSWRTVWFNVEKSRKQDKIYYTARKMTESSRWKLQTQLKDSKMNVLEGWS